ncbi:MAG: hypothetical protein GY729_13775 [Desulfobacteraceae bacterium]|nr:hypothetical protein [Desulfobacteraceae bacterium]
MDSTVRNVFQMMIILFLGISLIQTAAAEEKYDYEKINLQSANGWYNSDAGFFKADGKKAVVFVPGMNFSYTSWSFLADQLQKKKIASLCLGNQSEHIILAAITFLEKKGFDRIGLVGGSAGGGSVLTTLAKNPKPNINLVVALAPYLGKPVQNKKIKKLFVAASEDTFVSLSEMQSLYDKSDDPRTLKVYEGSAHAQQLFETEYKDELIPLILDFIMNE